jgi:hypothetical protein
MKDKLERCFEMTRMRREQWCCASRSDPLRMEVFYTDGVRVVDYPDAKRYLIAVDAHASGDARRMLDLHGFMGDPASGEIYYVVPYDKASDLVEKIETLRKKERDENWDDDWVPAAYPGEDVE